MQNIIPIHFSWIEFPGYPDNNFIATQAPRPNSIKHFWHMVIQAEVFILTLLLRWVQMILILLLLLQTQSSTSNTCDMAIQAEVKNISILILMFNFIVIIR